MGHAPAFVGRARPERSNHAVSTRTTLAALAVFGIGCAATTAQAYQLCQVKGGTVTLTLFGAEGAKMKINQTAAPQVDMENASGFAIQSPTNLVFRSQNGNFKSFEGG